MVGRPSPSPPGRDGLIRALSALLVLITIGRLLGACTPLAPASDGIVVERIIDGDTLVLVDGIRVRLLGLDAPELARGGVEAECFGPEAKAFLEALVSAAGWRIRLEYEAVRRDRYGRTLAYLWDRDRLLNEIILKEGYARFFAGDAVRWRNRLEAAGAEARTGYRGMWHPDACP